MLGAAEKNFLQSEKEPIYKMGKSIVAKCNIKKGEKLTFEKIAFKSPGAGLPPFRVYEMINKIAKIELNEDSLIKFEDLD